MYVLESCMLLWGESVAGWSTTYPRFSLENIFTFHRRDRVQG